jgi:hypothetical protein
MATETGRFVSVDNGVCLLRNFADAPDDWRLLNKTGKWIDGTALAARFLFKGEFGFEDITLAGAEALAAKLGDDLRTARTLG